MAQKPFFPTQLLPPPARDHASNEKVKNIEDKLVRLQDLYIEGNIDKSEYKIAKERYDAIQEELKSNEVELKDKKKVIEIYENALTKLESIEYQYNESDIEGKRRIIGSIFPKKFQFENKKVRTLQMNKVVSLVCSKDKASEGFKKRKHTEFGVLSPRVDPERFELSSK